jgi:lipid-binding SYLF domain-containing protein
MLPPMIKLTGSTFLVDSKNNGLDKVIPNNVLEKAAGFAIFTVVKAGFLVSARAGSGVVIARLPDGGESLLASEEGG